eukprot:Em0056g1a
MDDPFIMVPIHHDPHLQYTGLVVILSEEIHVFSFPHASKLLKTIETSPNPKGLCEVCSSADCQLMAFPGPQKGTVRMVDLLSTEAPEKAFTETICSVHQHELSCLAIDQQGALLASTSMKGTLIRIHSTQTRQLLVELRRGVDMANIYCLNFSLDSNFLCCCSDKGTVHVYAVKDQSLNKKSRAVDFALVDLIVAPMIFLIPFLGKTVSGAVLHARN